MSSSSENVLISKPKLWMSYALSGIAVLFMVFDTGIKVLRESHAVEGTIQLGYPDSSVVTIGIIEAICLLLYIIPRTSVLGVVLMTGYLGGAVATHIRLGNPLFSHILFSVYIAILLWGGLYLREQRLRELIPFRK
ncbi:MAG: DoxX family protein [Bacteroidota bacterium]|nr:DoxX family protein [Bacteroidota bacterium]